MFDFEISKIVRKGFITIKKDKQGFYRGDTVADGSALTAIYGKRYFLESDWDAVLRLASEKWDVGLAEILIK
jgi:hypothetical protein